MSLFFNIVLILWYTRHLIILYLGVLYAALYFQVYRRCSNLNPRISKTISRKIYFLIMTNHFLFRSWPFPVKNVSSNINLKSKEKFLIDIFAINSMILIFSLKQQVFLLTFSVVVLGLLSYYEAISCNYKLVKNIKTPHVDFCRPAVTFVENSSKST